MTITTVTSFANAPAGFAIPKTEAPQLASQADIPIEFFIEFDRSVLHNANTLLWPYPSFNTGIANSLTIPVLFNGVLVNPNDTSGQWGSPAVRDSAGNLIGEANYEAARFGGTTVDVQIYGNASGSAAAYALAPERCELVFKHACTASYEFTDWGPHDAPKLRTYMGFRPMPDWTGPNMVFIDNLGFAGRGYFQIDTAYSTETNPVPSGDRNLFAGFLLRSAMGKAVRDIADADIVMGVRSVNNNVSMIVNGVSIFSGSIVAGAPNVSFYYEVTGSMENAPVAAFDSIPILISSVYAGTTTYSAGGTATYYNTIVANLNATVNVNFAGAVAAHVSDMDLIGRPGEPAFYADGYHSTGTEFNWGYFTNISEAAMGLFFPAPPVPPFWTNKLKTTEITE